MYQVTAESKPNRLIHETSPYLLQHAHNPVDWYPWGEEALAKARRENKPIFLSIGYSSCHWCHVMAHECFEDQEIAALMNRDFVCIKVDREERPDLDHIYQAAAHLLTGQGGWPLSVFLTPDLRPFYAGTYFPPKDRYGRPGFPRVLRTLAGLYKKDPDKVAEVAQELTAAVQADQSGRGERAYGEVPSRQVVADGVEFLSRHFDHKHGGFGTQPKFPNAANLELFLHQHGAAAGRHYVDLATFTLRKMAAGGIYDHIGGGFHRYSTDAEWLVPHFEKMLYDNALLVPLYLTAYQLTGEGDYARVARETLDYVSHTMTHPAGGFYTAEDADSEGEEGKFYVWEPDELREVVGERDYELVAARYGVTPQGNFEDNATVLHLAGEVETLARRFGLTPAAVSERLDEARQRMYAAREARVHPSRDEKILAGWNGLMVSGYAKGAAILQEPRYAAAAERALEFLWQELQYAGGRLRRSWRGQASEIPGFLEDYAYLCLACLDTYEATFNQCWLQRAAQLMESCIEQFWDGEEGGFYLAPAAADLIVRPKDAQDQSIPSGNAVAAVALLRLHSAYPDRGYLERAEKLLRTFAAEMSANPWGTAAMLNALDLYHSGLTEVAVVVPAHQRVEDATPLLAEVRRHYLPNLALHVVSEQAAGSADAPAACQGKKVVNGRATAYVCRNFTCSAPVTEARDLGAILQRAWTPAIAAS